MLIGENTVVSLYYTLTNDDGEVIDQSREGEPLVYLHGAAGIIPGLEDELDGKKAGDDFKATISPEDGYGAHDPSRVQASPRGSFPADLELEIGMQLNAESEGGVITVVVTDLSEDLVTFDANHPLAGLTLHFEGSVEDVREATQEELDALQVV